MIQSVKVYGCGSIGNHLANASRRLGWSVDMFDIDRDAIMRTKNEIYPSRYGQWDPEINLLSDDNEAKSFYDLIVVGTPPDSHIDLARAAVKQSPKAILVEKPCCTPDLKGAQELFDEAAEAGIRVYVGYDHVVGKAASVMSGLLSESKFGQPLTLDVEFREFWGGIFEAHPWLDGPQDSYLGFSDRGGGACGEHSHALNLWQNLAYQAGMGRVVRVNADMNFVKNVQVDYDQLCLVNLTTDKGFSGRVVQDVITRPTKSGQDFRGHEARLICTLDVLKVSTR